MSRKDRYVRFIIYLFIILAILFFFIRAPDIHAVSNAPLELGAHRGDSLDFIENTIPAFKAAIDDPRYRFIELDIQYTKDKRIIVFHDFTLLRLHKKLKKANKLTYEELSGESDYKIPLFEDVIEILKDKKSLNIEIKSNGNLSEDKRLVDYAIDYCRKSSMRDPIISSVSKDVIHYVAEQYPEIETGIIYWIHPVSYIRSEWLVEDFYDKNSYADYLMLHAINLKNYQLLAELKPENQTLVFWYFTDEMFIVHNL